MGTGIKVGKIATHVAAIFSQTFFIFAIEYVSTNTYRLPKITAEALIIVVFKNMCRPAIECKNSFMFLKPTHGLPAIPLAGVYSWKVMSIACNIGITRKTKKNIRAGIARTVDMPR